MNREVTVRGLVRVNTTEVPTNYYPPLSELRVGGPSDVWWMGATGRYASPDDRLLADSKCMYSIALNVYASQPYAFHALSTGAADPLGFHRMAAAQFVSAVAETVPKAAVYGRVSDGVLDLWVIVPERDEKAEFALAELMCDLTRAHPNLDFDFMVLDQRSSGASDASESGYLLLSGD
jgi:hypothetical protein